MRSLIFTSLLLTVLTSVTSAQEYLLKNGRRFPASAVKISGANCTASVVGAGGVETVVFTIKDIAQATFAPVPDMAKARDLILQKKFPEAYTLTDDILRANAHLKPIAGNPWVDALLLQLDALEGMKKKSSQSTHAATLMSLTRDENELVTKMIAIVDSDSTPAGIEKMRALASSTDIGFIQARALLRVADLHANFGNLETAAKEYLCIPLFYATDTFLSFRATLSATNCLFQIKRGEDAIKILDQYLTDNPLTKYKTMIETEKLRFKAPAKDEIGVNNTPAPKDTKAEKTPAPVDAETTKEPTTENSEESKDSTGKEEPEPDKIIDKSEITK